MLDCLARRVPNWMAVFLYLLVSLSPNLAATSLSIILSPSPLGRVQSAIRCKGTFYFRQSTSGEQRKGYLASLPLFDMALSSLPKFLIHNLSKSNTISLSCSSIPARRYATRYLEYPLNNSSAPSPDRSILDPDLICDYVPYRVPSSCEARDNTAEILKSMCVFLGQMSWMCDFSISSMDSRVQSLRMRLYFLSLLIKESSQQALREVFLSGASGEKTMLIRSISASWGSTRSKSLAIRVESSPPEKSTAMWALVVPGQFLLSLYSFQLKYSWNYLMLETNSITLCFNNPSISSNTTSREQDSSFGKQRVRLFGWIYYLLHTASFSKNSIDITTFLGTSKQCLYLELFHSLLYLLSHSFSSFYSYNPSRLLSNSPMPTLLRISPFSSKPINKLFLPKQSLLRNTLLSRWQIREQSPRILPRSWDITWADSFQEAIFESSVQSHSVSLW